MLRGSLPRAKLTVKIPGDTWIGDVSTAHPDAVFRVIAALAGDERGVGVVEIEADHNDKILEEMREHPSTTGVDVLQDENGTALVQFHTKDPLLLFAAYRGGVPVEMPFEIQDGKGSWELSASHGTLSRLGEQLREFGIDFTVDYVQEIGFHQLLTDKQQELVLKAVEMGYYDTPRTCSLSELSDEVGLAKSTCSETLHRAEEKIVKEYISSTRQTFQ